MPNKKVCVIAMLLTISFLGAAPSRADFTMTIAPDFAMLAMMRQVRDTNNPSSAGNERSGSVKSIKPDTKTVQLVFSPSSSRRQSNLAKFVEKTRATDPAGATKMAQLFASTDIIEMIDQKMQQAYDMRANNVADAYAVWWVSAWMGAQGRSDDATPGQMAMVKQQAANALSSTPEFAQANDAGKQEMAEAMLVQAALIGATIDTFKSDPAMLAKTRTAIAKGAREIGIDLTVMKLTDEGFRPKAE